MSKKFMSAQEAVAVLASQTERKTKFFSREAAIHALVAVIKSSKKWNERAGIAASFAVHFADELRAARKVNTRKGYILLLEDLVEESKRRVNMYDRRGSVTAQMFPAITAWFATPEMVYDVEAYLEVSERVETVRNKRRSA